MFNEVFKRFKMAGDLGSNSSALQRDHRRFKMDLNKKPKVELHVHLDGSVRPTTIWDIAQASGHKLPVSSREKMRDLLCINVEDSKTLTEFLEKFYIFMPVLVTPSHVHYAVFSGNEAGIRRISYEFCEDLFREHVIYAEARIAPHLLAGPQLPLKKVVEVILEEFERGYKDFGVKVNLILACMRHEPGWSAEVLDLCVHFRSRGVAGIDLAGDENLTKTAPTQREHIEVFQEAERLGIRRTVHAGENGSARNVQEALDEMHAERIGHGYNCLEDAALYRSILERRVHLEACPMSSFITGSVPLNFKEHPIHKFACDGANFSINSDDPTMTGCFLHGEYEFAQDVMALSDEHLIIANFNAVQSAFLSKDEKTALYRRLVADYEKDIKLRNIDIQRYLSDVDA